MGLNGIKQTVVLWKGNEEMYEKFMICDTEFCIKQAVLLPFENVCLLTYGYNKEGVVEVPPYFMLFGFCHTPCRHSH
jgi:hypothetical protein